MKKLITLTDSKKCDAIFQEAFGSGHLGDVVQFIKDFLMFKIPIVAEGEHEASHYSDLRKTTMRAVINHLVALSLYSCRLRSQYKKDSLLKVAVACLVEQLVQGTDARQTLDLALRRIWMSSDSSSIPNLLTESGKIDFLIPLQSSDARGVKVDDQKGNESESDEDLDEAPVPPAALSTQKGTTSESQGIKAKPAPFSIDPCIETLPEAKAGQMLKELQKILEIYLQHLGVDPKKALSAAVGEKAEDKNDQKQSTGLLTQKRNLMIELYRAAMPTNSPSNSKENVTAALSMVYRQLSSTDLKSTLAKRRTKLDFWLFRKITEWLDNFRVAHPQSRLFKTTGQKVVEKVENLLQATTTVPSL